MRGLGWDSRVRLLARLLEFLGYGFYDWLQRLSRPVLVVLTDLNCFPKIPTGCSAVPKDRIDLPEPHEMIVVVRVEVSQKLAIHFGAREVLGRGAMLNERV
jgi:hypothetical protein